MKPKKNIVRLLLPKGGFHLLSVVDHAQVGYVGFDLPTMKKDLLIQWVEDGKLVSKQIPVHDLMRI